MTAGEGLTFPFLCDHSVLFLPCLRAKGKSIEWTRKGEVLLSLHGAGSKNRGVGKGKGGEGWRVMIIYGAYE